MRLRATSTSLWKKALDSIGIRLADRQGQASTTRSRPRSPAGTRCGATGGSPTIPTATTSCSCSTAATSNQSNVACYSSPTYDALYERRGSIGDSPERTQLFEQMARQFEADSPWRLRVAPYRSMLVQPRVIGYKAHPVTARRMDATSTSISARADARRRLGETLSRRGASRISRQCPRRERAARVRFLTRRTGSRRLGARAPIEIVGLCPTAESAGADDRCIPRPTDGFPVAAVQCTGVSQEAPTRIIVPSHAQARHASGNGRRHRGGVDARRGRRQEDGVHDHRQLAGREGSIPPRVAARPLPLRRVGRARPARLARGGVPAGRPLRRPSHLGALRRRPRVLLGSHRSAGISPRRRDGARRVQRLVPGPVLRAQGGLSLRLQHAESGGAEERVRRARAQPRPLRALARGSRPAGPDPERATRRERPRPDAADLRGRTRDLRLFLGGARGADGGLDPRPLLPFGRRFRGRQWPRERKAASSVHRPFADADPRHERIGSARRPSPRHLPVHRRSGLARGAGRVRPSPPATRNGGGADVPRSPRGLRGVTR